MSKTIQDVLDQIDGIEKAVIRIEDKLTALTRDEVTPVDPAPVEPTEPVQPVPTAWKLTRITDHANQPPVGFARVDYSRRQALNVDDSAILVYARDGHWHLYTPDGEYVKKISLAGNGVGAQWGIYSAGSLYYYPNNGGTRISIINTATNETLNAYDFGDKVKAIWPTAARCWDKSEGSPSRNNRYWGFQAETDDFKPLGLIVIDLFEQRIVSHFDFATDGNGIGRPDHVSMSPSGRYIVPSWHGGNICPDGQLGTTNNPCGLMVYNRDMTEGFGIARKGPHSDIALNAKGEDVIVYTDYDSGYMTAFNLDTHEYIKLFSLYENRATCAFHISGKAYDAPGKVLISSYGAKNGEAWFTNKIFSCTLEENPAIEVIADTNNIDAGYWSEPHASVNRDFTKIVFNSNMGIDTDAVDVYMLSKE